MIQKHQFISLILAILFLSISLTTYANKDSIDEFFDDITINIEDDEKIHLVGLQQSESWLVIMIDFAHDPLQSSQVDETNQLLRNNVPQYFSQATGEEISINIDIYPQVVRAKHSVEYYGNDENGNRDTTSSEFMPPLLAEEAILSVQSEIEWEQYDLNTDGVIDRLLILHSTKGQEEGVSKASRIWSHFTFFEDPLDVGEQVVAHHYTMASLRSGQSGIGTLIHEMLHQMGASDLYPEDGSEHDYWKGPGVWDIMASGNWNDNGRTPSLPTASTMKSIGFPIHDTLDLHWPKESSTPCFGPMLSLDPRTEGGRAIEIPLSTEEFLYIEYRKTIDFDEGLPGDGLLVTYVDQSIGMYEENYVNMNPNMPHIIPIEADGRNDLRTGANDGEASDLFGEGDKFGAEGIEIFNHDGIRVDWTAEVTVDGDVMQLTFNATHCSQYLDIDLNNFMSIQSYGEDFVISGDFEEPCSIEMFADREHTISTSITQSALTLMVQPPPSENKIIEINGTVDCQNGLIYIEHPIQYSGIIPIVKPIEHQYIPHDSTSNVEIEIPFFGSGTNTFQVRLDGPLTRVVDDIQEVTLSSEKQSVELTIRPNGLLVENMIVEGTIILILNDRLEWAFNVTFITDIDSDTFGDLLQPSSIFTIFFGVVGVSYVLTLATSYVRPKFRDKHSPPQTVNPPTNFPQQQQPLQDAWGRALDEYQEEFHR